MYRPGHLCLRVSGNRTTEDLMKPIQYMCIQAQGHSVPDTSDVGLHTRVRCCETLITSRFTTVAPCATHGVFLQSTSMHAGVTASDSSVCTAFTLRFKLEVHANQAKQHHTLTSAALRSTSQGHTELGAFLKLHTFNVGLSFPPLFTIDRREVK